MIVYVAEQGCYSDKYMAGVFDSVERAIAELDPDSKWKWTHSVFHYGNEVSHDWRNSGNWSEAITISETRVEDAGPLYAGVIYEEVDE